MYNQLHSSCYEKKKVAEHPRYQNRKQDNRAKGEEMNEEKKDRKCIKRTL